MVEHRFSEVVTTEAQVRAVIGRPDRQALTKASAVLDEHCRAFISRCPFLLLASCDAEGGMDISPKGDPEGFVRVLDESTLVIPDRPGNRRADTFTNVLERPHVGLLLLVPGRAETLRIGGTALIVRDRWIRDPMAVAGKVPDLALVVKVSEVFFHCPKCIVRSGLWDPAQWPSLNGLASFARIKLDRSRLDVSVEEMEALVARNIREHLY